MILCHVEESVISIHIFWLNFEITCEKKQLHVCPSCLTVPEIIRLLRYPLNTQYYYMTPQATPAWLLLVLFDVKSNMNCVFRDTHTVCICACSIVDSRKFYIVAYIEPERHWSTTLLCMIGRLAWRMCEGVANLRSLCQKRSIVIRPLSFARWRSVIYTSHTAVCRWVWFISPWEI